MAVLRTVLNNDECLFFPGSGKDKKRSRGFWVSKVENMPAHLQYKKGIEDPNREGLKWLSESEFSDKLHWKKNSGVTKLEKREDGVFEIEDSKGENYRARFVILCTGVMDVQPHINESIDPILPFANVQLADYCIRCDGHHVHHLPTAVIGHDSTAPWTAIILKERYDIPSLTMLTHGKEPEWDEKTQEILDAYGVKTDTREIDLVLGNAKEHKLEGLKFKDGNQIDLGIIFISLGMIVYNDLAKPLGTELDRRGFVVTNEKGLSSVDGLYVAGDLRANAKKQIYTAWDHAVDSADAINSILRAEKRDQAVKKFREGRA
jgi:thioredoxin reductase (NADPH)